MRVNSLFLTLGSGLLAIALTGCTVRTYSMTRDRVDQELTAGNRGFLQGNAPPSSAEGRKMTREVQVTEIELGRPVNVAKRKATSPSIEEISQPASEVVVSEELTETVVVEPVSGPVEKYTVQKGDTLQKISQKFYGTTKKWYKIYKLNQDKLKGPDKIRPGMVIDLPAEGMNKQEEGLKEPTQNLK